MFTFRKLLLGEKMRLFMMVVLFVVFVVFSTQFVLNQETITDIILSIVFLSFVSFFFVLSEVLRYYYRLSTKALIVKCDPKLAEHYINIIKKIDIIKGYKNSILVFYTLMYLDQGKYDELDKHIDQPGFQTSASLKLVYHYNKFYIAVHQNDLESASSYFKLIQQAYSKNTKKRKTPKTVYSINLITADYYLLKVNLNKAEQNIKVIDENYLNLREKTYLYISYAKLYKMKNASQKEQQYLNQAKDISEELYHVKHYI